MYKRYYCTTVRDTAKIRPRRFAIIPVVRCRCGPGVGFASAEYAAQYTSLSAGADRPCFVQSTLRHTPGKLNKRIQTENTTAVAIFIN